MNITVIWYILLQVHTDLETLLAKKDVVGPTTIGSKIASGKFWDLPYSSTDKWGLMIDTQISCNKACLLSVGLSVIYLPPLPPAVEPFVPPPVKHHPPTPPHLKEQAQKADQKMRTSLK